MTSSATGKWIDANESFLKMIGRSRKEVIGHDSLELKLIKEEERGKIIKEIERSGSLRNIEIRIRNRSGESITVLNSMEQVNINGESCILTVLHDITERKEMERELRDSEEKFLKMFHASPVGITLRIPDSGKWTEVNESFLKMIGMKRNEVLGRNSFELGLVSSEDWQKILRGMKRADTIRNVEVTLRKKSGENIITLISLQKVKIGARELVLTIHNDITDQKRKIDSIREDVSTEYDIYIRANSRLVKLNTQDICWIEAQGDYVRIRTQSDSFTVHTTMKKIQEKLPAVAFMRVHHSFIVRIDKIAGVQNNAV